ncbi:MAG: hypothetical protein R6X20_04190 [Phycisphaerae bacterium]
MSSEKQRRANRRNAKKSTGPKTPEGKARSSKNALKHGLDALRDVLLPEADPEAYRRLRDEVLQELAPEGFLQRTVADQVVHCLWQLRRVPYLERLVLAQAIRQARGEAAAGKASAPPIVPGAGQDLLEEMARLAALPPAPGLRAPSDMPGYTPPDISKGFGGMVDLSTLPGHGNGVAEDRVAELLPTLGRVWQFARRWQNQLYRSLRHLAWLKANPWLLTRPASPEEGEG